MSLGGASVWSNFSYYNEIKVPEGCLINANGTFLIYFTKAKNYPRNNIKVFTHLFFSNHFGKPIEFKNSRLLSLECALETWNELVVNGWKEVSQNMK